MTKDQLKHLAMLPKVIEALRVLAAETEEAHRLMQRVGMAVPAAQFSVTAAANVGVTQLPPLQGEPVHGLPGPVVLMTPERQEYMEQLKNPKPAHPIQAPGRLPAAQRQAIERGYMASIQGERQAKMGQFQYDGHDESLDRPAVAAEQLTTLSGAT